MPTAWYIADPSPFNKRQRMSDVAHGKKEIDKQLEELCKKLAEIQAKIKAYLDILTKQK